MEKLTTLAELKVKADKGDTPMTLEGKADKAFAELKKLLMDKAYKAELHKDVHILLTATLVEEESDTNGEGKEA